MSMTRPVAVTLGLAAVLAGTAVRADACTCLPKSEVCGAASEYWRTAVVFLGRVDAIERPAAKDTPRYLLSRRVRLRVLEPFRGSPPAGSDVIVLTGAGGGDCGFPFTAAQEYLVYASRRGDEGELATSICSRTRPAAEASADLEYARAAAAGRAAPGRVTGQVRVETRELARSRRRIRPAPLAGIMVRLTRNGETLHARTDEQGRYAIESPAPGRYTLGADLPDAYYARESGNTLEIADSRACLEADLTVMHDGRVTGRVIDPAGRAVPGLTIDLTVGARIDEPATSRVRALTRRDGTFELTRVPPGTFVVGINTERSAAGDVEPPRIFYPGVGDLAAARAVVVPAGGRVTLDDFVLPGEVEYLRVEGTVLAADGSPASGARVYIQQDSEKSYITSEPAIADASGRFVVSLLAGTTWRLFAERNGIDRTMSRVEASDHVTVTPRADMPPVRIQLRRRY
jgi:hypothetical protein